MRHRVLLILEVFYREREFDTNRQNINVCLIVEGTKTSVIYFFIS